MKLSYEELDRAMARARRIHFVGIGGISMSSLAAITLERGYAVSGSDRNESRLTRHLSELGATIHYTHDAAWVNGASLVVYTAAVHGDNPEMMEAERLGIPAVSRADYLGWLMREYTERIGVAGTHGKSTVTSMLTEIYLAGELDPTVVSGAELREMGGAYRIGGKRYFLFEACEYCDSFLSFFPSTAVITNVDYDHADYFKSMDQLTDSFRRYLALARRAVLNFDDPVSVELAKSYDGEVVSYALNAEATYRAEDLGYDHGCAVFDLTKEGKTLCRVALSVPGQHNVMDALAAAAAALSCGATPEAVVKGLAAFGGAKRRFEYMGKTAEGADVYNDYAHHPIELKATLSAAKSLGKRVVAVFQPHTYSRTAAFFHDFAASFGDADAVILADIYAAREENVFGVTVEALTAATPRARYLGDFDAIAAHLLTHTGEGDLILILGAGDILSLGGRILGPSDKNPA